MNFLSLTRLAVLATALFVVPGCVELTGQRISWFHDEASDELRILIFYDGIHESADEHRTGTEQIPTFVQDGGVMIVDWWMHFDMAKLRLQAEDPEAGSAQRKKARLITTSIRSESLGYYREPDGRIGAAQLVTISNLKAFLRGLNATINITVLDALDEAESSGLLRTLQRMREAGDDGHQWVSLDGHAIRFRMPVHPGEWAHYKRNFLKDLFEEVAEALGDDGTFARLIVQGLSSVPFSYIDEGDWVTFVLGRPEVPSTLRLTIRDEYEPSLEQVVIDTVLVPLRPATTVLEWGPPEEGVRFLIHAAEAPGRRDLAIPELEAWAESWNAKHGIPEAPPKMDDVTQYLMAWKAFYKAMKESG